MSTKKAFIILLAGFVMASCSKEESLPADSQIVDQTTIDGIQLKGGATHCESLVYDAISGNPVAGSATLLRTDKKISMTFKAEGLNPGHAYTIWWVIWNKPEECIIPFACDVPDYAFADIVEVDALYAAGHVVGNNGKGNFSGSLKENDNAGSINDLFDLPKYGLYDARTAEVHLVLRDHGLKIPGQVSDQINFYPGGCVTGDCNDPLFAVFPANCGLNP